MNLRRDPRITVLVETGDEYDELKGLELVGRAEVFEDRESLLAIGRSTARRYFGVTAAFQRAMAARMAWVRSGKRAAMLVVSWMSLLRS